MPLQGIPPVEGGPSFPPHLPDALLGDIPQAGHPEHVCHQGLRWCQACTGAAGSVTDVSGVLWAWCCSEGGCEQLAHAEGLGESHSWCRLRGLVASCGESTSSRTPRGSGRVGATPKGKRQRKKAWKDSKAGTVQEELFYHLPFLPLMPVPASKWLKSQ
jgi:hypothetical protein